MRLRHLFIVMSLVVTSHLQAAPLWQVLNAPGPGAASVQLPVIAVDARPVSVAVDVVTALQVGSELSLRFSPTDELVYVVQQVQRFENGDLGLRAEQRDALSSADAAPGSNSARMSADTLTDSDGDGISDFNEALLGTNPNNASSGPAQGANVVIDVRMMYTPKYVSDSSTKNAVLALNTVRFQIARYFAERPLLALANASGASSNASARGGVIRTGGPRGMAKEFATNHLASDQLSLVTSLSVDPAHVGQMGVTAVPLVIQ